MENASKALIIAGAILLSILIISLGIMIFSNARGVVDTNTMDEVAVTTFNSKFTQYEGTNIRGANVNSLIDSLIQNNLTNSGDTSKQVTLIVNGDVTGAGGPGWSGTCTSTTAQTSSTTTGKALTGKSYSVTVHKDDKSGYVDQVTIGKAT